MLSDTFINDLDDGVGCTLSELAGDTKPGGAADAPRVVLPSRGTRTGWRNGLSDLVKLSKGKCQVLPLGRNSPRHQDLLGATQLERSLAEMALGVLEETELTMGQQCTLTAKAATSLLSCIRQSLASRSRGRSCPPAQHW